MQVSLRSHGRAYKRSQLYLHSSARQAHALRYNKTNGNLRHRPLLEIFSPQFVKSGSILRTSKRQFPKTTSMPVAIITILSGSQIDAGSLIQAERNKTALKKIQEKIMRTRST